MKKTAPPLLPPSVSCRNIPAQNDHLLRPGPSSRLMNGKIEYSVNPSLLLSR